MTVFIQINMVYFIEADIQITTYIVLHDTQTCSLG